MPAIAFPVPFNPADSMCLSCSMQPQVNQIWIVGCLVVYRISTFLVNPPTSHTIIQESATFILLLDVFAVIIIISG